jgi:Uma2 family endonuclease
LGAHSRCTHDDDAADHCPRPDRGQPRAPAERSPGSARSVAYRQPTARGRAGSGEYRPEPDVGVIDADYEPGQRFVDRAYLLAEVVSNTDNFLVPEANEPWINVKRRIYLDHAACEAVLIIEQDRIEVRVDRKTGSGWQSETLEDARAELVLPEFGLRCTVAELYAGTPLHRRAGAGREI